MHAARPSRMRGVNTGSGRALSLARDEGHRPRPTVELRGFEPVERGSARMISDGLSADFLLTCRVLRWLRMYPN